MANRFLLLTFVLVTVLSLAVVFNTYCSEQQMPTIFKNGRVLPLNLNTLENNCGRTAVTNFVFLKTHKTAGSTVQNILMRFGHKRDLIFALGAKKILYKVGEFPAMFSLANVLRSTSGTYNILCHHTRFNQDIKRLMPANAVYFTILRDPVSTFMSYFSFFDIAATLGFNDTNGIDEFLTNPSFYSQFINVTTEMRNSFLVDFGMDSSMSDNSSAVYEKILEVGENFDFVMISEYFDESLVLLRHLLHWSLTDVVYVKINVRPRRQRLTLNPENIAKIKNWKSGDQLLYDHFNRTFWKKARLFGLEKLRKEVDELVKLNEYWRNLCFDRTKVTEIKRRIPGNPTTYREVILPKLSETGSKIKTCELLSKIPPDLTDIIYEHMWKNGQLLDKRPPKLHFPRVTTDLEI